METLKISNDSPDNILIEVLDEDIGKDDNMGNLSLSVLDLIEKQSLVNQWMPLSDCKSGEILISVNTHKFPQRVYHQLIIFYNCPNQLLKSREIGL